MFAQIPAIHSYTRIFIWTIAFAIGLLSPLPRQTETLGDNECYGLGNGQLPSCEDKNPETMHCDGANWGTYYLNGGAKIWRRTSSECNAKWTKIINNSGATRYTAGCTRYGGMYYDVIYRCVQSGMYPPPVDPIANGQYVYTQMVALTSTPTLSCGTTSTSSITLPYGGNPPLYLGCAGAW